MTISPARSGVDAEPHEIVTVGLFEDCECDNGTITNIFQANYQSDSGVY
jgi:hypothetical protein